MNWHRVVIKAFTRIWEGSLKALPAVGLGAEAI